jgi:hypothetical protein
MISLSWWKKEIQSAVTTESETRKETVSWNWVKSMNERAIHEGDSPTCLDEFTKLASSLPVQSISVF